MSAIVQYGMPGYLYHSLKEVSSSQIKTLIDGPAYYKHSIDNPGESETTDEMTFGTIAHALLLGEEDRVIVLEFDNWKTKEARMWRDGLLEHGYIPCLKETFDRAKAAADSAKSHPLISAILDHPNLKTEVTIIWEDATTGVNCRARLDMYIQDWKPGEDLIIDPKFTTLKLARIGPDNYDDLAWAVKRYRYDIQAAHYSAAANAHSGNVVTWRNLWIEQREPHLTLMTDMSLYTEAQAVLDRIAALNAYKASMESGIWPGSTSQIVSIGLPGREITDEAVALANGELS